MKEEMNECSTVFIVVGNVQEEDVEDGLGRSMPHILGAF